LPPHASDMLTTRPGNWWCGDLHPTRFSALSAAPAYGDFASVNLASHPRGRSRPASELRALLKPDVVPVETNFNEIAKWTCKWQDCCLE